MTALRKVSKEKGYSFFVTVSYVLSHAVNAIPELRHRLIDGDLWEYDRVDPGYTVLLRDNSFSFCDSMYFENFEQYYRYASTQIESVKKSPDRTTGDKDHMFFISNVPWFSFTAFTHPYDEKYKSIPVLTTGKYFEQDGKLWMPLAIQVHHGLVDGIHVGMFYERVYQLARSLEWLQR